MSINEQILFSIVVPTYNRAHLIAPTIESILAQTYRNFELIIVDDGSTDDTEEALKKYLSDNVFYYKKKNEERAAARNYGAQKAKGDYVNWFDSDDIMYPDNLQDAMEVANRYHKPEIFIQGIKVFDGKETQISESNFSSNVNLDMYKGNQVACSPVFVRRDIALANPFNEDRALSASEDYELWLRLASKYQFYTSAKRTVAYIFHDGNSTVAMRDPQQLITRYNKFLQYTTSDKGVMTFLGAQKNYFLMKNYLLLAVDLMIANHRKLGLKYLMKSLLSSPRLFSERGFYAFMKYFFKNSLTFK